MSYNQNFYMFKGNMSTSNANFDLREMMQLFSFEDMYYDPTPNADMEAAIVITGKQIIASYSANRGEGVHVGLYARIMCDLHGGGDITTQHDEIILSSELQRKYIVARIDYATSTNEIGRINYRNGTIAFCNLHNLNLSLEQIEQFERFYEEFNESIKLACERYGFHIRYTYLDAEGVAQHRDVDSLDEVLDFVQSRKPFAKSVNDDNEVLIEPGLGTRG